jgi:hypothetical protein
MSSQTWNIIGSLCGLLGVLLLFRYGMPYRVRTGGASFLILNQRDADDLRQEKLFDIFGWIGLVLVIAGTACQNIANTCLAHS